MPWVKFQSRVGALCWGLQATRVCLHLRCYGRCWGLGQGLLRGMGHTPVWAHA